MNVNGVERPRSRRSREDAASASWSGTRARQWVVLQVGVSYGGAKKAEMV